MHNGAHGMVFARAATTEEIIVIIEMRQNGKLSCLPIINEARDKIPIHFFQFQFDFRLFFFALHQRFLKCTNIFFD